MMAVISFTLPEDQTQLDLALLGPQLAAAVLEMDETLHQAIKHEEDTIMRESAQRWRVALWDALRDVGVTREMIER
jgi:hypothetical protein